MSVQLHARSERRRGSFRATALIVAHDDDLRTILGDVLETAGFATLRVGSLQEASSHVIDDSPALVVLDTGLDVGAARAWIDEHGADLDAPAMIVVAGDARARMMAERVDLPVLDKPFELEALLAMVADARVPLVF